MRQIGIFSKIFHTNGGNYHLYERHFICNAFGKRPRLIDIKSMMRQSLEVVPFVMYTNFQKFNPVPRGIFILFLGIPSTD